MTARAAPTEVHASMQGDSRQHAQHRRGCMHACRAQAAREGRLREMFGCGTACIVQPVDGLVRAGGQVIAAPWDAADPHSLTQRLTRALTDIQYGRWGPLPV